MLAVLGLGPTQVIVDFVPPGASDVALTKRSVSGVSVKVGGAFGVPLVHVALWSTETGTPLPSLSFAYPDGAAVSVTV
jgi:hypothetical protein